MEEGSENPVISAVIIEICFEGENSDILSSAQAEQESVILVSPSFTDPW